MRPELAGNSAEVYPDSLLAASASPGLVGLPTNPLAESVSRPTNLVIDFALWVVKNLGLTPPSQTSNAGYA